MSGSEPMTPSHPKWREFCEVLAGPGFCNFTEDDKWMCDGSADRPFARKALATMGFDEPGIETSVAYFGKHGGHCDCEILFNVDR